MAYIHRKMTARMEHMLRVGYNGNGYVEKRLLTELPFRSVKLVRKPDIFNALAFVQRTLFGHPKATSLVGSFHRDWGLTSVSLFHLINRISLGSTPWVSTFEHYLPRWNYSSNLGWKYLAAQPCKKLIAISQWAYRFQEHLLAQHPHLEEAIRPKMCVITPAQQVLLSQYEEKVLNPDRITFTIVGGDFFRKGGLEILEVFSQLVAEGLPVQLTVVSSLLFGDYASRSTKAHVQRARDLMTQMGTAITYVSDLENRQVLHLLTRTHVALLPTYDDTYGFSVLEGQAAGCPAITTDVCALPEFNDDTVGWMIHVPKDPLNQPLHKTVEEREQLSCCIRENLSRIVHDICADPSTVKNKGERALERIRMDRSPENRAALLESIYHQALA